jgi:L-rhamnose-H+ transport protein
MRYLGLSLAMSVALGFCSPFVTLIPPIYRDLANLNGGTFAAMIPARDGRLVLLGAVACLIGIGICDRANRG